LALLQGFELILLQFVDTVFNVGEMVLLLFESLVGREQIIRVEAVASGLWGGKSWGVGFRSRLHGKTDSKKSKER
jgi:hypothetical protein